MLFIHLLFEIVNIIKMIHVYFQISEVVINQG